MQKVQNIAKQTLQQVFIFFIKINTNISLFIYNIMIPVVEITASDTVSKKHPLLAGLPI
jgi:hypothetical protein